MNFLPHFIVWVKKPVFELKRHKKRTDQTSLAGFVFLWPCGWLKRRKSIQPKYNLNAKKLQIHKIYNIKNLRNPQKLMEISNAHLKQDRHPLKLSIEFAVADRLGDMFGGYLLFPCQIGYCAGNLANLIMCASAEAKLGHRLFQHHFTCRIKRAEFLGLLMAHPRVSHYLAVAEPPHLNLSCFYNAVPHRSRADLPWFRAQLGKAYRRHIDMNIYSIHQRPRYFRQIPLDLVRRTFASSGVNTKIAAWTPVRSNYKNHKPWFWQKLDDLTFFSTRLLTNALVNSGRNY